MINRRKFVRNMSGAMIGLPVVHKIIARASPNPSSSNGKNIIISTWNHGLAANQAAWNIINKGGKAIDAVEAGVRIPEADPSITSVGLGGFPDATGKVTLDACIQDANGNCGAVTYLQHIKHPISVARLVMDKTPHVMLSGQGALDFAVKNGFKKEKLLTKEAKAAWKTWKKEQNFKPIINRENHDTIGLLAIDNQGDIAGACTTSGAAFKLPGRVGDSPIIGAGLFCDNEVGGATATGQGELVMKTLGSFLVVELMRNGMSPQQACEEAVRRIVHKIPNYHEFQIGYIAINKSGEYGAYCLHQGFNFALNIEGREQLIDADYYIK